MKKKQYFNLVIISYINLSAYKLIKQNSFIIKRLTRIAH